MSQDQTIHLLRRAYNELLTLNKRDDVFTNHVLLGDLSFFFHQPENMTREEIQEALNQKIEPISESHARLIGVRRALLEAQLKRTTDA
jgi:hypothetical protein